MAVSDKTQTIVGSVLGIAALIGALERNTQSIKDLIEQNKEATHELEARRKWLDDKRDEKEKREEKMVDLLKEIEDKLHGR